MAPGVLLEPYEPGGQGVAETPIVSKGLILYRDVHRFLLQILSYKKSLVIFTPVRNVSSKKKAAESACC